MTRPTAPIRLYQFPGSGHCHRARLFLSLLGLPFEQIDMDRTKQPHKAPAFLAKNPLGQVPVIEDGDIIIADSNAILVYLALSYDESERWLPRDAIHAAQVQRWLSQAAGELAAGPMTARRIKRLGSNEDFAQAKAISERLFGLLDNQLAEQDFLVDFEPTIADIALYSYTALAPQSDLSLDPWPHVQAWLKRIESLPGFVPV